MCEEEKKLGPLLGFHIAYPLPAIISNVSTANALRKNESL